MISKRSPDQAGHSLEQEKSESLIGKTFNEIIFDTKKQKGINKTVFFVNGTDEHKIMYLDPAFSSHIEEGKEYSVEITQDTRPDKNKKGERKGKLFVKIIAEDGVPFKAETARKIPLPIEIKKEEGSVLVIEAEIPYNKEGGPLVPDIKKFELFTLDEHTLKILHKVAGAVEQDLPLLLEGDTAATKTSAIEYLAAVTNHEVIRLNLSGQTDTSELIGKFVPNDGEIQMEFETLLKNTDTLQPISKNIVEQAMHEGRELTKTESQLIATNEGLQIAEWRWQDGAVHAQ
jgi:hypothetical protein